MLFILGEGGTYAKSKGNTLKPDDPFFLPLSCTKLDKMAEVGTETLAEEQLPEDGSIPLKYGNLVSVSDVVGLPEYLQLWFQDENGDLRVVRYFITENRFLKVSHLIPRN